MALQKIRERLSGIILFFILAILIIPFAFVGVGSYFSSDSVNAVAIVNDQEITINDFNTSFQNYRRRMQAMLGEQFDAEMFDQAMIRRQHLDTMIDEELLSQASADAGLTVADAILEREIRDVPAFQVDGEFNRDVYRSRLQAQGLSSQQFQNDMRVQLTMNQFPSVLAGSAISTQWELDNFVRLQEEKRGFSALIVPAVPDDEPAETEAEELAEADEAVTEEATEEEAAEAVEEPVVENAEPEVSEEEILAFYEANSDNYTSQEQVIIEFLELDADTMGGSLDIDEEQLRARFDEQQARFITPESRLASHILLNVDATAPEAEVETVRETALALAERARAGEDFSELAIEFSQDAGSAPDGGDLGWVEPGFMVQAFEDGLYALSLDNPISDPVQSGFGWHVILLRDVRESEGMSFTEAREILLEEYQAELDEVRFLEQADRLVDIIYEDPTTLLTASEELSIEVQEAGPFGRNGGFAGVAANGDVVRAAFSDLVLLQGAASDPIDLGDPNHLVIIRVKEHLPEAVRPLEEVREQVTAAVLQERAMEQARERAETLLADVTSGSDLTALSEESGLELLTLEAATRTSAEVPADLRTHLFKMAPPDEGSSRFDLAELGNGYAVVQLDSVTDGTLTEEEALKGENYKRRLDNTTANSEIYGFLRMLRSQSEIQVFEDRL